MDFKQLPCLLCVLIILSVASAKKSFKPKEHIECPKGQERVTCPGGIVATCGDYNKKCVCTNKTKPCETCACSGGLVFTRDLELNFYWWNFYFPNVSFPVHFPCIPRSFCPEERIKCPNGQKRVPCPGGKVPTCGNLEKKCDKICDDKTKPCETCACEFSAFSSYGNYCIRSDECELEAIKKNLKCPKGQKPKVCDNYLSVPTCDEPEKWCNRSIVCPNSKGSKPCGICDCDEELQEISVFGNLDLVFAPNGTCITREQCPKYTTVQPEEHIECPKNQKPVSCPNGNVPTCAYPKNKCGTTVQRETCACSGGLVFSPNGTCIPREQCPNKEHMHIIKCPKGQKPVLCPGGNEPTCDNPEDTCGITCNDIMNPCETCACSGGLVRLYNGSCIPKQQCPPRIKCPKGQEPVPCPGGIVPTCRDLYRKCGTTAQREKCACKDGLVFDPSGACIAASDCPLECPLGQELVPCPHGKVPTCGDLKKKCGTTADRETCACSGGLVFSIFGEIPCIAASDCPLECPPDKYAVDCSHSDGIVATCENMNGGRCACAKKPCKMCACYFPLLLAPNGTCISWEQCPIEERIECPKGQKRVHCPDGNVPTCHDPKSKCDKVCAREPCETCACTGDHVFSYNGTCIPQQQCPPRIKCPKGQKRVPCPGGDVPTCANFGDKCRKICANDEPCETCACSNGLSFDHKGKCVDQCPQDYECPKMLDADGFFISSYDDASQFCNDGKCPKGNVCVDAHCKGKGDCIPLNRKICCPDRGTLAEVEN